MNSNAERYLSEYFSRAQILDLVIDEWEGANHVARELAARAKADGYKVSISEMKLAVRSIVFNELEHCRDEDISDSSDYAVMLLESLRGR
jgi:hypothetical protein